MWNAASWLCQVVRSPELENPELSGTGQFHGEERTVLAWCCGVDCPDFGYLTKQQQSVNNIVKAKAEIG